MATSDDAGALEQVIKVDTTGLDLSNNDRGAYRRLFEYLLQFAKGHHRGNGIIPFDGAGAFGVVKEERWVDLMTGQPRHRS